MDVASMSLKLHALHHTCIITIFSCILGVCYICWTVCVLLGLDWAEPMMHLYLHVTCLCIFMHTYLQFFIIWYIFLLVLFWLSLSLSLSLSLTLVASWHLNVNPLRLETIFILGHLLLLFLTPVHLTYGSVMRRPSRTSQRTFHDEAFIRNAKSFYQIFLTLTYPLLSTVRVGSDYVVSQSHALPWSYWSSTPICTDLIILYLSLLLVFEVRAW